MTEDVQKRVTPLILNDEPVAAGEEAAFQFEAYADTLARLIAAKSTRTPLTLGVFGEWGTGKTTLLQSVRGRLDQTRYLEKKPEAITFLSPEELGGYRRCRTVWFNAWKYRHENEILVALVEAILRQMREDGFIHQVYAALAEHTGPRLRVAEATVHVLSQLISFGQMDIDLSKFQAESQFREHFPFLDEFQRVFDQMLLWYLRRQVKGKPNLAEATEQERRELDQQGVLAVFIDDLDRCLPAKTVQVLEAIKLIIGCPGTVFVLAASERVVQEAIRAHYKEQEKTSGADHQRYLEKLVQVRFELPPIRETDVESFVEELHRERGLDGTLRENLPLIAVGVQANPRRIKTFVNYVELQWALLYNSRQAQGLDRAVLTRWLVLDAAERSFTDNIRQLPFKERPEFLQDARALAAGQQVDAPARYDQWPREKHPRLWNVLKQDSYAFDVGPEVLDLLIHLSAPPVQAPPEEAPARRPEAAAAARERVEKRGALPEHAEGLLPALVQVPAGPFLMGSLANNPLAHDAEKPQHEFPIRDAYRIGRYPVTNAEYARFVEAKGYDTQAFWTEAGWQWKGDRAGPEKYGDLFDPPDHPVVGVSWFEAVAYCNWLDAELRGRGLLDEGHLLRLPSEPEWEKAARGEHGREWPWGDEFDGSKANTSEQGPGHTTPAGRYSPAGDSPYGCADMAGNVWEWCATKWPSSYKDYHEDNDLRGDVLRVVRGGSWVNYQRYARCACRFDSDPHYSLSGLGFRVVVAPGLPSDL